MIQEANERAFEISVEGQRLYENEKKMVYNKKSREEENNFQKALDKLDIDAKILASAKLNETRIKRMVCRNEQLEKLKIAVKERIMQDLAGDSDQYRQTVQKMIVQGMIRMLEEKIELKVR